MEKVFLKAFESNYAQYHDYNHGLREPLLETKIQIDEGHFLFIVEIYSVFL